MDVKTLRRTSRSSIGVALLAVACTGAEFEPGGTGGAGGAAGVGGLASSGGVISGGGPATGGTGGVPSCGDLMKRADAELQAAQSCNMSLSRAPCVDTVLSLCNCPVIIDLLSSPAAQAYLATKAEIEGRKDCLIACPAVLCSEPGQGRCQVLDSGVIGTCVDSKIYTTVAH